MDIKTIDLIVAEIFHRKQYPIGSDSPDRISMCGKVSIQKLLGVHDTLQTENHCSILMAITGIDMIVA